MPILKRGSFTGLMGTQGSEEDWSLEKRDAAERAEEFQKKKKKEKK